MINPKNNDDFAAFCVSIMETIEPRGEHDYGYSKEAFRIARDRWLAAEQGKTETKKIQLLLEDSFEEIETDLLNSFSYGKQ